MITMQLLDEMVDNGFPLVTEKNVLVDMVRPPTILNKIKTHISGHKHKMWVFCSECSEF